MTTTDQARPFESAAGSPKVVVRRSTRRKRTVSAHREGDTIVVSLPARMSAAEERRWVEQLVPKVLARDRKLRPGDPELLARATALSKSLFDGQATPSSVRWSSVQRSRWGSCSPLDRTIRISERLREMPMWVLDYVLVHELAHLLEVDHTPAFWALVARYPRAERARGYLEGHTAAARGTGGEPGDGETGDDLVD